MITKMAINLIITHEFVLYNILMTIYMLSDLILHKKKLKYDLLTDIKLRQHKH